MRIPISSHISKPALVFCLALFWAAQGNAEPVCTIKPVVDLRVGPSPKSRVSWTVGKYMPFMKVAEQKDKQKRKWYQVQDVDGEMHWVRSNMVSTRAVCAVIKSKQAKLREGPGKEFPAADLSNVDKYTPFKKLDRDGEWVLLQDDYKTKYWVHETNLWIPMLRSSVAF